MRGLSSIPVIKVHARGHVGGDLDDADDHATTIEVSHAGYDFGDRWAMSHSGQDHLGDLVGDEAARAAAGRDWARRP